MSSKKAIYIYVDRVVWPNFEYLVLTSSFTKYKFLQVKKCFGTSVNGLSVLKLFQLSNGDYRNIYKMLKSRMKKLGQGVWS